MYSWIFLHIYLNKSTGTVPTSFYNMDTNIFRFYTCIIPITTCCVLLVIIQNVKLYKLYIVSSPFAHCLSIDLYDYLLNSCDIFTLPFMEWSMFGFIEFD